MSWSEPLQDYPQREETVGQDHPPNLWMEQSLRWMDLTVSCCVQVGELSFKAFDKMNVNPGIVDKVTSLLLYTDCLT